MLNIIYHCHLLSSVPIFGYNFHIQSSDFLQLHHNTASVSLLYVIYIFIRNINRCTFVIVTTTNY